ncbi:MAG: Photosystem II reaction center X protein [Oscillatoriales cyanobacterium SM2_1_8]|nr:Photosystem II reaction center X protein [Oscillatoriales cyanobacterium SM2_1_8]
MTPSLINFFWGLGFGVAVVLSLGVALVYISQKDKLVRRG